MLVFDLYSLTVSSGCLRNVPVQHGVFTGVSLSTYFGPGKADWVSARAIINGNDMAQTVANLAKGFLHISSLL